MRPLQGTLKTDLVLTGPGQRLGIEIKHTAAPRMTEALAIAIADTHRTEGYIVTAGKASFQVAAGIRAVPLPVFLTDVVAPLRQTQGRRRARR